MEVRQKVIAKVVEKFPHDIAKLIGSFIQCCCKCHGVTEVLDCVSPHCRNILAQCSIPCRGVWMLKFFGELYSTTSDSNTKSMVYVRFERHAIDKDTKYAFTSSGAFEKQSVYMKAVLDLKGDEIIDVVCSSTEIAARNAEILFTRLI